MTKKIRLNVYLTESYANLLKDWCSSHPGRTYGDFIERCIFKALSKPDTATGIPHLPPKKMPDQPASSPKTQTAMPRPTNAMPRPNTKEQNNNVETPYEPPERKTNSLRKHSRNC